jgi:phage-related protein
MADKPLQWVGSALSDLRQFPDDARRRAGFELHVVQQGLNPSDWKPMPSIGPGVAEIRIHTGTQHRIFYVARFEEAVYVLHAFEKKTQKTARQDLDLGRARLADVLNSRSTSSKRRTR